MPEHRSKILPAAITLFALLNVFVFIHDGILDSRPRIDFYGFYEPSAKLRMGESPFPQGEISKSAAYVYPQAWAFAMIPLTLLEKEKAAEVWWGISLVLLLFTIAAGTRYGILHGLGGRVDKTTQAAAVIAVAAGLGFTPALFGWNIGQLDILLTAILALVLIGPPHHRAVCAGLCVGIGTLLKVSPLLLVPALAFAFGPRFLVAFAGVIAAYVIALFATGTFGREMELFTRIMPQLQFTTAHPDTSLYRLILADLFGSHFLKPDGNYGGPIARILEIAILLTYATACWLLKKRNADWLAFLAVGIAFSHLASPFLEPHHYTNTLLVFVPWVALFYLRRDWLPLALLGVIWFIGFNFQRWHSTANSSWPGYLLFLIDLILLLIVCLRPNESPSNRTNDISAD